MTLFLNFKLYHSYSGTNDDDDVRYLYSSGRVINVTLTLIVCIITLILLARCNIFWPNLLLRDQNFISVSYFFMIAQFVFLSIGLRKFHPEILNYILINCLPTFYILFLVFLFRTSDPVVFDEEEIINEKEQIGSTTEGRGGIEMTQGDANLEDGEEEEYEEEEEEDMEVDYDKDFD